MFGSSNDEPYAFLDPRTQQVIGIDAEMFQYILGKLGIPERRMVQDKFSGLIPGLLANRFDVIADAMYITAKRREQIEFSDPWYQYGETMVVAKGNPKNIRKLDAADLKGKKAASYLGTVYQDWLDEMKKDGVEVSSYPDVPTALQDIRAGRLDVALVDAPVAAYDLATFPELQQALEIVADYTPREVGKIGAGFRKEDVDLRLAFNKALAEMKTDGTDLRILQKWGLTERNRAIVP